jgi:hypothetical protein
VTHQHQIPKGSTRRKAHPETYSSSQLSIEVSELHAGTNGRLEITCVSTIPASVAPGEQFADYKTFSVKGKRANLGGMQEIDSKALECSSSNGGKLIPLKTEHFSFRTTFSSLSDPVALFSS